MKAALKVYLNKKAIVTITKVDGFCAQSILNKILGCDASLFRFNNPYRPRIFRASGGSKEVCLTGQTNYDASQFAPGTRFKTS